MVLRTQRRLSSISSSAGMLVCLLAAGGVLPCAGPVWAAGADSSTNAAVEEIFVVAARTPRQATDIASSVDVITHEDIATGLAVGLGDTVRYLPGVSVTRPGTRFPDSGLSIRGIGGNRVVTLIDRVPVPDQFAIGAFASAGRDYLVPDSVSRMEILRGPASTLFGSDALGGVLAVVTRGPDDYLDGSPVAAGLSHTYSGVDHGAATDLWAALSGSSAAVSLHVSSRDAHEPDHAASGPADPAERQRRSAALRARFDLGSGTLLARLDSFREEIDTDLRSLLGYGRRYRNTTLLLGDDERDRHVASVAYQWTGNIVDRAMITGYAQRGDVRQDTWEERGAARAPVTIERRFDYETDSAGVVADFETSRDWLGVTHRIGWGVDIGRTSVSEARNGTQTDWSSGLRTNVLLGERLPVRDFPDSVVREAGLYLHDEVFLQRWTLLPGVRFEAYDLDASSDSLFLDDNAGTEVVDLNESAFAPRFGVLYHASERTQWFAQYAHGFRAPPFEDVNVGFELPLFNYRGIPNPDLRAETSDGLEIGLRYSAPRFRIEASVFGAVYDDFIETRAPIGLDADGVLIFQSRNVDEARIYGVEVSAEGAFAGRFDQLGWDVRASWVRGENRTTGEPLNSVDPAEMVASLSWRPTDRWRVALTGIVVAGKHRVDDTVRDVVEPAGYAVFDLLLRYAASDRLQLDAGVFNLFDRTFWQWSSVRGRPTDDPTLANLSAPGRYASVALRWTI